MIKDLLYRSDILYELITPNNFEFLNDCNKKQMEFENDLKIANDKKEKIEKELIKIENMEDYSKRIEKRANAQIAHKSVENIIKNLIKMMENFKQIENSTLDLMLKENPSQEKVKEINDEINRYKEDQKKYDQENVQFYEMVNEFLNEIEPQKEKKVEVDLDTEKITEEEIKLRKFNLNLEDNLVLRVSEKEGKIFFPYTKQEVEEFLEKFPKDYKSANDVVRQEFIADFNLYNHHPVFERFREAYALSRNKEMKPLIESVKFAMNIMFRREINPIIIAAVKSEKQLESYIECLEKNKLEDFKYFKIIFEINPI